MIFIYMNVVLFVIGVIVVLIVIVGIVCLMKRKINDVRYFYNIFMFYICFVFLVLKIDGVLKLCLSYIYNLVVIFILLFCLYLKN